MYTPWPFSDLVQELGDKVEIFDFEKYNFVTPIIKPAAMDRAELLDRVMHEAYDAELSSCGYWPGGREEGAFYSYAYPEPPGFRDVTPATPDAVFDTGLGEFVLPYATVRTAPDPETTLLAFLRETAAAAADLASWPSLATAPGGSSPEE